MRIYQCLKCDGPSILLNGLCEACTIKQSGILKRQYRERPQCRVRIIDLVNEDFRITLFNLAFWTEFDTVPVIPSDGIRTQARKMLKEQCQNENS